MTLITFLAADVGALVATLLFLVFCYRSEALRAAANRSAAEKHRDDLMARLATARKTLSLLRGGDRRRSDYPASMTDDQKALAWRLHSTLLRLEIPAADNIRLTDRELEYAVVDTSASLDEGVATVGDATLTALWEQRTYESLSQMFAHVTTAPAPNP